MSNQELQKTKIWKRIIDNICGANLVDMQDKFDKEIRFLLCVIDIFSKYAWVVSLKEKKRYYNYWLFSKLGRYRWQNL